MSDTISRQAAIDAVTGWETEPTDAYYPSWYVEKIRALPSAEPQERKTGKWEYVDYGGFGNWHCTACRKICICNGDYNYCPNCGAKMEVEHEID